MIQATKLTKTYGTGDLALTVLRAIDISIEGGEFVAIIGPSGAGKSTLLYQLSLLDDPTSGEISIGGVSMNDKSQESRAAFRLNSLGYVFQDYALLPELTALENVALPMIMQGNALSVAYKSAEDALKRVGLADKVSNLPSALSGGQQQRVSIARAIAHHPSIVFADEPTANLDTENSAVVLDAFLELNRGGQTIVMVTHEDEYARRASRVITLRDGRIVSDTKQKI